MCRKIVIIIILCIINNMKKKYFEILLQYKILISMFQINTLLTRMHNLFSFQNLFIPHETCNCT